MKLAQNPPNSQGQFGRTESNLDCNSDTILKVPSTAAEHARRPRTKTHCPCVRPPGTNIINQLPLLPMWASRRSLDVIGPTVSLPSRSPIATTCPWTSRSTIYHAEAMRTEAVLDRQQLVTCTRPPGSGTRSARRSRTR
jgi:hypothetical protein